MTVVIVFYLYCAVMLFAGMNHALRRRGPHPRRRFDDPTQE